MNRRHYLRLALILLCAVLLSGGVRAAAPINYRLDWVTPLTTGNGGPAASDHYAANLTVGQTAVGTLSSHHYRLCLGYWCGAGPPYQVYLPLVARHSGP